MKNNFLCWLCALLFGVLMSAQLVAQEATELAEDSVVSVESTATTNPPASDKKIIRDATISLQTTVTGNQEQPRVMYILPWQSPLSPNLDIEMFNNQQEAVFGHVEREELLRGLEAAGEFDQED